MTAVVAFINSFNSDRLFRWYAKAGRFNCALGEQHPG